MVIYRLLFFTLILCFNIAGLAQPSDFISYWDHGYKVESIDGQFKFKFGGRLMFDAAYLDFSGMIPQSISYDTEIRRARIFNSGTIYGNTYYKWQVDFGGNKVSIKDMHVGFREIPIVGKLQAGKFKEPLRLNSLTSSKYITFLERAMLADYLEDRNLGIMAMNELANERLGWQVGVFRGHESSKLSASKETGYAFTGRLTGLPMYKPDNRILLHLGVAASYRNLDGHMYEVSSRPAAHLASKILSTGKILGVEELFITGGELAVVLGPLSFQAEYIQVNPTIIKGAVSDTYIFSTYYGYISYFITGESRVYDNSYEGFDRIRPRNNFGKGGWGAWELAIRYDRNDVGNSPLSVYPEQMSNITSAINWYPNPGIRIMLNYVHSISDNRDTGNVFQIRFQADF